MDVWGGVIWIKCIDIDEWRRRDGVKEVDWKEKWENDMWVESDKKREEEGGRGKMMWNERKKERKKKKERIVMDRGEMMCEK